MPRRRTKSPAENKWSQSLKAWAVRFHEDEEGATLVFAAATFFALAMSIAFVFQIGVISSDRLQIQGAADAAAYSGALVEANSLNAIGQINDGITYVNYIAMRHAVDAVVYSVTLNQYTWRDRSPAATGQHGYVIMGGDSNEGNKRIDHVTNHFDLFSSKTDRLIDTLRWRNELFTAARVVMRATPRLVRTTASEVAAANGASDIGFSDDLERAWRLGDGESDGFSDRGYVTNDDHYSPAMYERYEGRQVVQLDKLSGGKTAKHAARELPRTDWFDKKQGKFIEDYFQIRLCWRKEDWDHGKDSGPHSLAPYTRYRAGDAPNAHWHHGHAHTGTNPYDGVSPLPGALPHRGAPPSPMAFLDEGGHQDEDQDVHQPTMLGPIHATDRYMATFAHHAVRACWNCNYSGRDKKLSPSPNSSSRYSEIMATSGRDGISSAIDWLNNVLKPQVGNIVLREPLLRSGLTVATYRRARGLGGLFPESPWGMIAVASAQVGVETGNGVTALESLENGKAKYAGGPDVPYWNSSGGSNTKEDRRKNLFYDAPANNGRDGFHFSARLVPVARKLTWQADNESGEGLKNLLTGRTRWYQAGKISPTTAPSPPPPIGALGQFLKVDSREDLEAFWH